MQKTVGLIENQEQAASLADPIRRRIVELMREPNSATGVAQTTKLPRQRVAYYVKDLEQQGLLRLVEERRRGNCVERLLQSSARWYVLAPQVLGSLGADPEALRDRFSSAYLSAVAAHVVQDMAVLERLAGAAGKKLPTLTIQTEVRFGSGAAQQAFAEELTALVADLAAKYQDASSPNARSFQLFAGGYPTPPSDIAGGDAGPALRSG
jgi:hypothetical protein